MPELQTPAGWYDDGSGRQRWWTGTEWSDQYAPMTAAIASAPQQSQYRQPQYGQMPVQPAYFRPLKDRGVAYLLAILLSGFGAHHFYLGHVGRGIAFILLWWGGWSLSVILIGIPLLVVAAIWWIVDLFTLTGQVDEANQRIMSGRQP